MTSIRRCTSHDSRTLLRSRTANPARRKRSGGDAAKGRAGRRPGRAIAAMGALAAVGALALSACGGDAPDASDASASPTPLTSTASGAFDAATVERLDELVRRFQDVNQTPGALIGVWSPQGTYVSATGTSDIATEAPLEPDMQFKIASQTKSFTGNLVLQLVSEGKVGLDDHISRWIEGVPNGDEITIRQLLNHTSGLADAFTDPSIQEMILDGCTADELLTLEAKFPPVAEPGEKWSYSNYGFNLLGRMVELVEGQDLSTVLEERITEPLGLTRTSLATSGSGLTAPYTHGYGIGDLGPTQAATAANDATDIPLSCLWAHGGMVSTLEDMHVWMSSMESLVTPEVWKEATTDMVPFVFGGNYNGPGQWLNALGFDVTGGFYVAEGSFAGYESATMYSPTLDTTIAVATTKMWSAITPPPMMQALAIALYGDDVDFGLTLDQAMEPNLGIGSSPSPDATSDTSDAATTTGQAPGYATELQPVLQDLVDSMEVPSAVVVVRSSTFGDATFEFGTRELGRDDPPSTTDHYRIGSLTKTMTATVILQLAQEGKLSLDDPISKYRPDVPNGDNITIANLLDMRSGLYGYDLDPTFLRAVDEDPERIWSPDELLAIGYSKPALFAPGTAYDYSNTNYILLGLVMEDVTDQTASELFQERLFDPLGLEDTTLPTLDDASIPADYAHGYMFASAEKTGGPDPALTPEQQEAAAAGELLPTDWSASNPSWGWTAGSVISTADDLVVWANAVVDGELLEPEMQAYRMASYQATDSTRADGLAYGSGMLHKGDYYGHAGLLFGYNSHFLRDPGTDTTIVALTGLTLAPDGRLPTEALLAAVTDELSQSGEADGPLDPSTRAKVQETVRTFQEETHTPGAMIGIWSPKGTFVSATGVADLTTEAPLTTDMQFKIGSQTKAFVANLVLQLVGEGKVSLDDRIAKWVADVPNGDEITIRQLLAMKSGLGAGFLVQEANVDKLATGCTEADRLAAGAAEPALAPPGTEWIYSNYGYDLLGRVVELTTGQDVSTAIQERIAQPLGLHRTLLPTSGNGLSEPFTHGYGAGDVASAEAAAKAPGVASDDATALHQSCLGAEGGMVSTMADLHVWSRALATGALLEPSVWEEAQEGAFPYAFEDDYNGPGRWLQGLGFVESGGFIGKEGSWAGYESITMYSPTLDTTIEVVATKQPNTITPTRMFQALAMDLYGTDLGFGLTPEQALAPSYTGLPPED